MNWYSIGASAFGLVAALTLFFTSPKLSKAIGFSEPSIRFLAFVAFVCAAAVLIIEVSDENVNHWVQKFAPKKAPPKSAPSLQTEDFTPELRKHRVELQEEPIFEVRAEPQVAPSEESERMHFTREQAKAIYDEELRQRFHNGQGKTIKRTLDSRENFVKEMNRGRLKPDKYMRPVHSRSS